MARLRIGSRGSQLALWQAHHISDLLRARGHTVELEIIKTTGDKITDVALAKVGTKGMFTKEIEEALIANRIDLAVHSLKDLPTELAADFEIAAITTRENARDVFCSVNFANMEGLPQRANVGTSSLRRQAQLKAVRPDLQVHALRGNVDTRLRKLDAAQESVDGAAISGKRMDAIVLACAGLIRLGLESRITARLDPKICLPAVTQGVIGIECRQSDSSTVHFLRLLEDPATRKVMDAERAFAARLGGSCQSPIAAYAELDADRITLRGLVAEPDGSRLLKGSISGSAENPAALGRQLAERILADGAGPLLERLRGN
jgi:hydroxymethylbilane synthase